jgi:single-strand DNA-binding protein
MNKLIISGNLAREVELRFQEGTGNATLKNTVAVKRRFKDKKTDKYESDFIPVIAFGKTAEFIAEHFIKGQGIQIEAHMQSGSYDNKEGKKVYTLDAIIENVEFLGSKGTGNNNSQQPQNDAFSGGNFEEPDITPVDDRDTPFN